MNLLSCMKYHYVQSYILFSKCSVFWQWIVGDMKNAQTLSLIKKKNFQISEHQNKDQRKDGWYGVIAILTMQTHTPSFLQVLST